MTKCSKCGKSISEEVKFCSNCGEKVVKINNSNKLKLSTRYYITSIVAGLLLFLGYFIFLAFGFSFFYEIFGLIIIIWPIFNFFTLIYFLAKKYELKSIVLPGTFITQTILYFLILESDYNSKMELLMTLNLAVFPLFILGYSVYYIWKK